MSILGWKANLVALSVVGVVAFGCDDPAKNKAKAVTGEAQPVTAAQVGQTATYGFDGTNSKIGWVGSKVTGKHDGGFSAFKGTVSVVDGAAEKSSVNVDIETASLTSDQERLTGHLKSGDFFDVAKFPKASFASTKIEKGGSNGATHTITGNLTLHGVTKAITFPATVKLGDVVDVDAEFAINRKDFGLVYTGKPDDLIRDDVVIKLGIHARKGQS
jgi:polyisoprenoid-binding protein YceI